ncbi:MAG: hypothetical protein HY769_05080 [Candidatus Stahlbacteria bacterium]|nr:hypothetical protein [Candidatus Stahlbacteria bacterium]
MHGSVRKGGTPDNSKDENVFNIQQGVAISLFIKNKSQEKCKVYYYDVWGKREDKYTWLNNNDKNTTNWVELEPHSPWYFFVPKKEKYLKEYQKYPSIKDIFLVNSVGVVTSRDNFVIDFDKEALKNRIMMFRNPSKSDEEIRFTYKLKDTSTFNLKEAREELSKDKNWDKYFTQILYRPFDKRWIYYNKNVIERPLLKVMQHMRKENLGIITVRQSRSTGSFCHAMVSDIIIEACAISNRGSEINYLFPLWLYPEDIFNNGQTEEQRRANMDSKITDRLNKSYKKKLLPEQIFYYIYGILYSNTYRKKHDEFLKYDFPRIPFTNDYSAFNKISKLGKKLVDLHLLRPEEVLDPPIVRFWGEGGDCRVEKVEFRDNRVEINKIKYFDKVLKNMWEYQIGGYQVLEKWLKERKDRILSYDELCNYNGCGTAIARTIQIQKEIDKIYPKAEKGIIDF